MNSETSLWLTSTLFALTYAGLALGKVPGLRVDRPGIALVGATLVLVTGLLSVDQAVGTDSIDYQTLLVLFGMMVVIGFLRLSGLFQRLTDWALRRVRTPAALLAMTIVLSGVLSAFLLNDIVCLTLTPLVLHLARRLRFDPLPHLIAVATAANVGSTGTITGSPQNIYIGAHSGISYLRFAERSLPVAAVGLVLNLLVVAFVYRRRLFSATTGSPDVEAYESVDGTSQHWLQLESVAVTVVAVGLFFTGLPLQLVALGAAAGLLLLCRVEPGKVYRQLDWSLLVLFTGLFIVVHAFRVHVVAHWEVDGWGEFLNHRVDLLSLVSAGLSNVVSNVPAVLLLEPVLQAAPPASRETAWLALAMSSTLAGNLTVVGSIANLIVVENGRREGVTVSFWEYSKVGVPLTVLTLGLAIVWLRLVAP